MSYTKSFARTELEIIEDTFDGCNYYGVPRTLLDYKAEIIALCEKFYNDETINQVETPRTSTSCGGAHWDAQYLSKLVEKLCLKYTIGPIVDTKESWAVIADNSTYGGLIYYQNTRDFKVIKVGIGGKSYYTEAIIWKDIDTKEEFTIDVEGICSQQYIKQFPFIPKTFTIPVRKELYNADVHGLHVDTVTRDNSKYTYRIVDKEQLEKVWEYYDRYITIKRQ
jgi:hypothetical protein